MLSAQTIPELLIQRTKASLDQSAYWLLNKDSEWTAINWSSFQEKVLYLANELQDKGLEKGQAVGIMGASNLHWEIAHLAILSAGGVVVGLDPNERAEQLDLMIAKAQIIGLFIDTPEQLNKLDQTKKDDFNFLIQLKVAEHSNQQESIDEIILKQQQKNHLPTINTTIHENDIATIIFTSGTTGDPKGIVYTHKQIIFSCQNILQTYRALNQTCQLASWLPLSNLFQRILNLCAIGGGAQIYFVEDPKKIIEYLPQINPHIFIAVPRFYEKLYANLEVQLLSQPKALQGLINYSLTQAENVNFKGLLFKKINTILLKEFRALFGHNIQYMVSGSAPMPLWLLKKYAAIDLLILEAYGLSENVLPVAANTPSDYKFGSVGKAMPGNEIILAEDNELLVKGPGVFNGYVGQEKRVPEQYHASGDYAEIDTQGFIRLTGRKSEVFKTSTGHKIAPVAIETLLIQLSGIDQAVIIGANKKFLCVIITLEINAKPRLILEQVKPLIKRLPAYKRPAGIIFSSQGFSLEKNEITANLKLKRKNIQTNFSAYIEQLYSQLENPESALQNEPVQINQKISLYKIARML